MKTCSATLDASASRLRTLTVAALTLIALCLATAGPAAALLCDNVAASKSLTLGPNTHSVKTLSNGGGYANVGCKNFVVDISVPSNSTGTGNDLKSFTIWTNFQDPTISASSKTACTANSEKTSIYKKVGAVFQQIGSWERQGKWLTGPGVLFPCVVVVTAGSLNLPSLNPPANGTDLYRVVSVRKTGAQFTTVTVEALHLSPEPEPPK